MKEFLHHSGQPFVAINVAEQPEHAKRLDELGMVIPAVTVGDRACTGLDFDGIAQLIGVDYTPPEILAPAILMERYQAVTDTVCALVAPMSVTQLEYKSPDRDRTMAELAGHIASIMRCFVHAYDAEEYDHRWENPDIAPQNADEIIDIAVATQDQLDEWWRRFGFDDPLDRVIETTWGARTLHEALERSVWHPMQHTRQLTMFTEERLGLDPGRRLSSGEMAGLPLPDGIHAGVDDA